jgi:hypothetical protein
VSSLLDHTTPNPYSSIVGVHPLRRPPIVEAARVVRSGPGVLGWKLDRMFVRRDTTGKVLCNLIDGTGPEFPENKLPWPVIGSKEKNTEGKIVNNPDLVTRGVANSKRKVETSWYSEAVRMTPWGKAQYDLYQEYLSAAAKNPTGRFADDNHPDRITQQEAEVRAEQCRTDLNNMVKAIKKAVELLRHMTAINEMTGPPEADGKCPAPRITASFDVVHKYSMVTKAWDEDNTQLPKTGSPIILKDSVNGERLH